MTLDELKQELLKIVKRQGDGWSDIERDHGDADDLLLKFIGSDIERDHGDADDLLLKFIGDEEVSAIYDEIQRWYA